MEQRRRVSRPVREILAYFLRNAEAADSLEGIVRWRLLEEVIHRSVLETQTALDWLVKKDLLVAIDRPSTGRIFRLNTERRTQAELLLKKYRAKPVSRLRKS